MNKKMINQYKLLYELKPTYGASSKKLFDKILTIVNEYKPKSMLDYGCGKSPLAVMLFDATHIPCYKYDPVFEEYCIIPINKVDLVICTDVLQHIPESELDENLKEISNLGNLCYYKIKCTDHPTRFPNGEPTNCTIYNKYWWKGELLKYYCFIEELYCEDETSVIFLAKNRRG